MRINTVPVLMLLTSAYNKTEANKPKTLFNYGRKKTEGEKKGFEGGRCSTRRDGEKEVHQRRKEGAPICLRLVNMVKYIKREELKVKRKGLFLSGRL